MKTRYYIWTWDTFADEWTPQKGVRCGPYSLFGLRKALRALRGLGYPATRLPRQHYDDGGRPELVGSGDPSVLVERR